MQTPEGLVKAKQTNVNKFGSYEAWREFMRKNGATGGKNGRGHKFAHGKVDPSEAGKKGGLTRKSHE